MKSNRRDFLKATGVAATGAVAGAELIRASTVAMAAAGRRPPNVVLIVADDQRADTIGALGNAHIKTPHLDRLATGGFAFRHARNMGAQNAAVCVPARAMLHTGRTLFRAPENMGDFVILPEALRKAGYTTFACGKWHNGTPAFARGFSGGGNIFFGGMHEDQFRMPVHDFDPAGRYPQSAVRTGHKFSSELFADAAVEFLEKQAAGKSADTPFFCYLAFTSPHDPRTPPEEYKKLYDPATMPLPDNFLPRHPFDNGELRIRDELLAPFPRTPENTRQQLCDYYGMISAQDAQVGRVLKTLENTSLIDNTIVIYTGDHGLAIGSHGLFGKQNVYEHSAGVPLIFSGPGVPAGITSDAFVYGFDIFPTICEMLGVAAPATVEGHSLAGIIGGRETRVHDAIFSAYDHSRPNPKNDAQAAPGLQRAVHDGRWKYHHYEVRGKTTVRLFDLQTDPHEINDLSADPAAAKEIPRLAALLKHLRRDLADNRS